MQREVRPGRSNHAVAREPRRAAYIGIGLFLTSLLFACVVSSASKFLAATLPVMLIIWSRSIVTLLLVGSVALVRHGRGVLTPARPVLQLVRGLLFVGGTICFLVALARMPLANATAIFFVYPFFVAAVAPIVLRETVTPSIWAAVIIGFIGLVAAMNPGLGSFNWHGLFAVAAGLCYGCHLLITRALTPTIPSFVTAFWTSIVGAATTSAVLPFVWTPIRPIELVLLLCIGLSATVSQLLVLAACKWTETSRLAPFGYAEIVGATLIGYGVFGDWPDPVAWLGMAIISASGVYVAISVGRQIPLVSRSRPPTT